MRPDQCMCRMDAAGAEQDAERSGFACGETGARLPESAQPVRIDAKTGRSESIGAKGESPRMVILGLSGEPW